MRPEDSWLDELATPATVSLLCRAASFRSVWCLWSSRASQTLDPKGTAQEPCGTANHLCLSWALLSSFSYFLLPSSFLLSFLRFLLSSLFLTQVYQPQETRAPLHQMSLGSNNKILLLVPWTACFTDILIQNTHTHTHQLQILLLVPWTASFTEILTQRHKHTHTHTHVRANPSTVAGAWEGATWDSSPGRQLWGLTSA